MDIRRYSSLCFLIGSFLTCLLSSPFALDQQLSSRFVLLALTLVLSYYFFFRDESSQGLSLDLFTFSYGTYVFVSICSSLWANTISESIFSSGRDLLGFLSFAACRRLFSADEKFFKKGLSLAGAALAIALLFVGAFQISRNGSLSHEAMYTVTGLNGHKNLFASFLFLVLFLLFAGFFDSRRWLKILYISVGLLVVVLLILLQSKAVYLSLLLLPLLLIVFRGKNPLLSKRKTLVAGLVFSIVTVLILLWLLPFVLDSMLAARNSTGVFQDLLISVEERIQLWKKTLSMISKHLWFGVGSGNWAVYFPEETLKDMWRAEELNVTFQRPHNDLLWIFSENGLFGIFFYLLALFTLLVTGLKSSNKSTRVASVFLLCFIVCAFCDFPKDRIEHTLVLNILLAFIYCGLKIENVIPVFRKESHYPLFPLAGLFLSGLLTLIGFLRHEGENFTGHLYEASKTNNTLLILQSGEQAQNPVYRLDPFTAPISWYMGTAHVSANNLKEATVCFEKARRETPYNRHVLNDLGSAYTLLNQDQKAIPLYEEALRISPRFDDARLNLVAIYINAQQYELAQKNLDSLKHDSERRSKYQDLLKAIRESSSNPLDSRSKERSASDSLQ